MPSETDNPFGAPAPVDDDFSLDPIKDDGGLRIKKGRYPGRLIGLTKDTSKAGNPMWVWEFILLSGPGVGRTMKVWTALTSAAMWKLGEILGALKLTKPGQATNFKKSEAIGRTAILELEDDEYQGRQSSRIGSVLPVPDNMMAEVDKLASASKATSSDAPV